METFVGDTIVIDVYAGISLSGYPTLQIKYKRPDGTYGHWTATIDPVDTKHMYYTTDHTDLNIPGIWVIQAHAESMSAHLHGMWTEFTVHNPIPESTVPPTTLAPTTAVP